MYVHTAMQPQEKTPYCRHGKYINCNYIQIIALSGVLTTLHMLSASSSWRGLQGAWTVLLGIWRWQFIFPATSPDAATHRADNLQVPGQFVGVRIPAAVSSGSNSGSSSGGSDGGSSSNTNGLANNQHLFTIACSPYESRRDSAYISGSIIEVGICLQAGSCLVHS
jgi:hypothetical protein